MAFVMPIQVYNLLYFILINVYFKLTVGIVVLIIDKNDKSIGIYYAITIYKMFLLILNLIL